MLGPSPGVKSSKRIPSLDGLRAISIVLVVLAHLAGTRNFPLTKQINAMGDLGFLGVKVFFIISGFLITTLLLNELGAKGEISLKNFYYRRALRIFPACYAYLGIIAVLSMAGVTSLRLPDFLHGFTYTMNYYHVGRAWLVGHLWSLSVEEQFYLIWPFVLAMLGVRRAMFGAATTILLIPLIRIFTELFFKSQAIGIGQSFQTVADSIATGCLLAGTRAQLGRSKAYLLFLESWRFSAIPCMLLASFIALRFALLSELVGETLLNLSIVILIDRCVRNPKDAFGRFLNAAPAVWLGTLSYSLYLWQQPFLNRHSDSLVCRFPYNLVLGTSCAIASYYCIEKPLLNLRARLRTPADSEAQIPVEVGS